jgi:hypothetical protein
MGVGRHDRLFGGRGAAQRTLDAMKRTYGPAKGEAVFKATVIKREHRAKRTRGKGRHWGL